MASQVVFPSIYNAGLYLGEAISAKIREIASQITLAMTPSVNHQMRILFPINAEEFHIFNPHKRVYDKED